MRRRMGLLACVLILGAGAFATWSLTQGQPPAATPARPAAPPPAGGSPLLGTAEKAAPRDAGSPSPLQQQMQLSTRRGADWLFRMNGPDGRFVHGYLPALKRPLEGDHFLRQAGAAFALARAARFSADERYAARATQAVLTILGETVVDPANPKVRHTPLPSTAINRLAAAGLMVMAVNELPAPRNDLLETSEQLCNYIRSRQRSDGSLDYCDPPGPGSSAYDPDGINHHPGVALYGLALSQRHRPAAWKTEVLRKALAYYRPWWQGHKDLAFVPWQTAACTEAFLLTKEAAFADFVSEMNDWVCGQQYDRLDPRRAHWYGGFPTGTDGPPQVTSAVQAEGLAEACRVARERGERERYHRYRDALERCLQFLTTLQYTDANTQHFADWYRPALLGGFHASHQDGNLRTDFTQHAVCAMAQYLTHVAR